MDFISHLLHLNLYLPQFLNHYGIWAYGILFLIIFLETGLVLTPFLPGDSLLFTLGALLINTHRQADIQLGIQPGTPPIYLIIFLLILAAFLGDNLNYYLGRYCLNFFKINHKINPKYLQKTHDFYTRHGAMTLIFARFIPIIRTFAPFAAGIGKMHYLKFVLISFLAAVLWINLLFFLGYFFGDIPWVKNNFTLSILIIIFFSLLPSFLPLFKKIKK